MFSLYKWYIVGGILAVAALIGAWFALRPATSLMGFDPGGMTETLATSTTVIDVPSVVPQTAAAARDGWQTYTSTRYRYSVSFPNTLKPQEYAEAQGALTLTVQDDADHAFQVYVTPYQGDQITKQRFLMDEPSGAMREPQDVVIDGVRATMFFGKNVQMGDTREVWFIRGGYLYEVVTYKELDGWLSEIMSTWKFL